VLAVPGRAALLLRAPPRAPQRLREEVEPDEAVASEEEETRGAPADEALAARSEGMARRERVGESVGDGERGEE